MKSVLFYLQFSKITRLTQDPAAQDQPLLNFVCSTGLTLVIVVGSLLLVDTGLPITHVYLSR